MDGTSFICLQLRLAHSPFFFFFSNKSLSYWICHSEFLWINQRLFLRSNDESRIDDCFGKLHGKCDRQGKNEERWEEEPRVIARKINKFLLLRYRQSAEHRGSTLCLRLLAFSEKIAYLTTEIIISRPGRSRNSKPRDWHAFRAEKIIP